MRANHTHSLGSKEIAAVLVHEFQRPATAARNAGQGLIRNMDMQSGFFGKQAVEIARKDGTLAILSRGAPLPIKMNGPSRTRDQVQQEYMTMSDSERQYRQEMYGAGG